MRIGELAKRAGVSVQAIRFYERRRLMRTPRRTLAGYRIYNEQDLESLTLIKKMQRFGFRLVEIRRVLQETAMKSKRLLERSKQPFWRSYRVQGAGAVVLCIGLCFPLIATYAAGGKLEDQNKAVARAAFFDYLNHRDFKRFEEIHTKDFVKHYNNSPAENLSEEMRDAKGQYDSSSDLTFTENWMIAEGDKVAVCFTAKGTHDGPFQGVPATGKRYELSAMTVWRFVDGKIAEEWVFSNDLDLYRQLGLFKEPGSTDH